MEMVGCMEPSWVGWLMVVGNSCAHFHVVCNFTWVAARVGNMSHLNH